MPGLQLLVQRLTRKRLARDRDPPVLQLSSLRASGSECESLKWWREPQPGQQNHFKLTPRRPRRHGRAGALDHGADAGHLRGYEMPGLQLLVQRLARKRLARDRDPPSITRFQCSY